MLEPARSLLRNLLRPLLAQYGRVLRYGRHATHLSLVLTLIFTTVGSAVYTYTRTPAPVHAATSSTLNFQARLMTSAGNTVPDGYYNIQFNLYDVSSGGSTLWTETRDFAGTDDRVRAVNGYMSVNLGSVTSLPSTINWDQEHWLGMTIRGAATCDFATTCTPADSEMTPRIKLTAVPYAFRAGQADNVRSSNTNAASTNSAAITIQSGNAAGATSNSGNITLDVGTATGTTGTLSIGTVNTSGITISRVGITTILQGSLRLSALDCTGNTNGGALTADASGNVSCSNDDGGGASGVTTVGAIDSQSKSVNGAVISGVNIYLQTADATYPGLVSTGAQDFAGAKTFTSPLTVGNTSTLGTLSLHDGNGQKTVLQPGNSAGDLTFVLPTTVGASNECLKNSGTAGTLTFANCNNGSGAGGSITLQDAYDAGNTITTTDARNLSFTLANTATDANFIINVATGSTGAFKIQNNGSDTLNISGAGAVSGATTITGSGTFNTTGGAIQTNSTDRITNAGALTNITGYSQSSGNFLQSGAGTFGTGTGVVSLNGATDIAATVSIATKQGATYTTAGSANNVAISTASLYRLDTSGAAQTITGITAGRDGQHLTLINTDAALSVTISNLSGSSSAANQISTGTGADVVLAVGASIDLIYDSTSSLWRVVGGVAGGAGVCGTCANTALSNLSGVNINTALNVNSGNLTLQTTTSGNIVLDGAGFIDLQDNINAAGSFANSAGNVVIADTVDLGDAANGIRIDTTGSILDINGDIVLNDQVQVGGASGLQITTAGVITDLNDASVSVGENLIVSAGGITVTGNSTIVGTLGSLTGLASTGTIAFSGAGTFSIDSSAFDVSTGGALSGVTGYIQGSGNFSQTGVGTFGTGTGAVSLNGSTTIASAQNFLTTKGADYSTVGSTNNVALAGALIRLTGASAQTITGIAAGTVASDGRRLTLVNSAAQAAILSNNSASSSDGNKIITGTGADLSLAAGASIDLIYDWSGAAATSFWRVTGGAAGGAGTCPTCANQQLSNLSGTVAINMSLLTNGDNAIDLGSSANSFRTLYADTSVLTPGVDTAAAGALTLGNSTATSVSICNSTACDTISIGTNADADAINVGDALDTLTLTGTVGVTGATSINNNANFATNINTGTSTGAIAIGNSVAGAVTIQNGTAGIAVTTAATTNNALAVTGNSLTTGNGLSVSSSSALMTSGNMASFAQTGSYTTPLAISGNVVNVNRSVAATVSAGAITLDSTNGNSNGNTPDLTWSHTVGSFSNRVLIVAIHMGGGDTVSSVTYGGVALSRIADAATDDASIWILVNPAVGTANVVVDNTAGSDPMAGRSSSWYNVDQTTPTGTAATATGSSTTPSVVVTSAAGEVVVDSLMSDNVSNPTVGAGQTLLGTHFTGIKRFGTSYEAGAASTTMSWTASNGAWAIAAIPLKPSSASYTEITGATQSISSSCTGTSCIDTSNVLSVSQLFGGATGAAVSIQNAGSGADIQLGNGLIQTANKTATSTNSTNVTIKTGNATGTTSNSGNISIDVGTATQTAGTISVGAANTSAITIGRSTVTTTINGNFAHSGTGTFGTGTGVVSLNGNTNVAATASLATMRGADYTTAGSANNVALNVASLYRLDTSGAAQTITGIAAGRDGQTLTLVNADAALAVTLSNLSASSSAANQITTGTGADLSLAAGASVDLIYDSGASLWRVVGGVAGGAGTCPTCANTALSNIASTNLSAALNRTSGNLALQTTTSGDITLTTAAAAGLVNILTGNLKVGDAAPTVSLNGEDAYIEGTLEVDGTSRFDAQLVVTSGGIDVTGASAIDGGQIDLNVSSNFATNINTGTSSGAVTIGNTTNAGAIALRTSGANSISLTTGTGAVNINSGATTANAVSIAANSVTTGKALDIQAFGLTSGTGAYILTSSTSSGSALYANGTNSASSGAVNIDNIVLFGNDNTSGTYSGTYNSINLGIANNSSVNHSQNAVRITNSVVGANTDSTTENLLLIDQEDTTAAGNTAVTNGINITNSGGSTFTNALTVGSGTQAFGTAINLNSTGITTDIRLQNGETIDNNTDGTIVLTGATTSTGLLTGQGGLTITGGAVSINDTGAFNTSIAIGSTGTISIGGSTTGFTLENASGTVSLFSTGASAHTILLGASTGDNDIQIGSNSNAGSSVIIEGGSTGGISIGAGNTVHSINIGTGPAVQTVAIGSTDTTSTTTIQGGTGTNAIALTTNGGNINLNAATILGTATSQNLFNTVATTLNIGGAVGAGGINLAGGSGSTGCTIDGSNGNLTCSGTISGGAAVTLQGAYDNDAGAPATITTTDADGDIQFILANTTTDANLLVNVASGSTSKFAVQKNSVDTFAVDANGFLTVQSAAALTNGQTAVTQTANVTSTSGGTMRGYQLNQTITSTTSAGTNIGHEINQTDNATALANTNTGLKVTLAGSNTSDSQIGIDASVTNGFGLRVATSGNSAGVLACANTSGISSFAVCADNTSATSNTAGVYARSSGFGSFAGDWAGSGVYGVSTPTGAAGVFYTGVNGETLQNAAAAYTSIGVMGRAAAGTGATAYGGYFTLASSSTATAGSALFASNGSESANILQLSDNTTGVFTVANGGAVLAKNETNSTAGFQVQNAAGNDIMTVDTTNHQLYVRNATDVAVLGAELVTSQDFTSANWTTCNGGAGGWTGTATTATHNTGNTVACSAAAGNFTVVSGATYQVTFQVASNSTTTNTVRPSIGGVNGPNLGANATHTVVITGTNTGALTFTPTTNFNGVISNISVRLITRSSSAIAVRDSSNNVQLEVRAKNTVTAFGYQSLQGNISGLGLTAFGYQALMSNSTGSSNTAIGDTALSNNSTGSDNTAVGDSALQQNTIGLANTAAGNAALYSNTSGSQNTAFGAQALGANATADGNTAFGYSALDLSTTGSDNTAIGRNALGSATTVSGNTAIGSSALGSATGFQNTAVGTYSLQSATGNNSVALGYMAGNVSGGSGVYLGYSAGQSETGSSKLYIENSSSSTPLIYGDFGTDALIFNGSVVTKDTANSTTAFQVQNASSAALLTVDTSNSELEVAAGVLAVQTTLNGSTTANGAGAASNTLILTSATNFNIGNYVQVSSTNCVTGVNVCYAKITNIVSNTLTISPALTWANASAVVEVYIPEIGGVDTAQALANRFGRGYFIDGVVAGNGTTYLTDGTLSTTGQLAVSTNGSERLRIDSGGLVTIRSTITAASADTGVGSVRLNSGTSGAAGYVSWYRPDGTTRIGFLGWSDGGVNNLGMNLENGANFAINGGNVMINDATAYSRFTVANSSGAVATFTRNGGAGANGDVVEIRQDGVMAGSISANGGTVSYNAFTGSHYANLETDTAMGNLVELTGNNSYMNGSTSEIVYGVRASAIENNSRILGTLFSKSTDDQGEGSEKYDLVSAVGNGVQWVVDEGQNISAGDDLISSSTLGHGRKDPDTYAVSNVVAKAAEDVNWAGVTETIGGKKHKLISVTYTSFSKTKQIDLQGGQDALVDDLQVTGSANVGSLNVSGATTLTDLTVAGNATIQGTLTVESIEVGTIKVNGHIITAGNTPVGQVLGASGTGASYVIDGNDTAGTLTITTGTTAISAGDLVKVTFHSPFGKVPKIVLSAQDEATNNAKIFPSSKTVNDYTLNTSQILPPNTTYTLDYFIIE